MKDFTKVQKFILILFGVVFLGIPLIGLLLAALPFLLVYFLWDRWLEFRNGLNKRRLNFELAREGKIKL